MAPGAGAASAPGAAIAHSAWRLHSFAQDSLQLFFDPSVNKTHACKALFVVHYYEYQPLLEKRKLELAGDSLFASVGPES